MTFNRGKTGRAKFINHNSEETDSHPIKSNPIHGWIQSVLNSGWVPFVFAQTAKYSVVP